MVWPCNSGPGCLRTINAAWQGAQALVTLYVSDWWPLVVPSSLSPVGGTLVFGQILDLSWHGILSLVVGLASL